MESSSHRTRSVGWRSSELRAPTGGPPGPGPPRPLFDPRGPMLGTDRESPKPAGSCLARSPRSGTTCCRGPARRSIYTGARARTARWGRGCRPRPPSGGPALRTSDQNRGYRTRPPAFAPYFGQPGVCSGLPGWQQRLEGGLPCGKRRHGRSCSVNESKCLGDRGLPGSRHAKGGGGGGEKRAGKGGGGGGGGKPEPQQQRLLNPGCAPARESEIKGI